MGNVDTAVVSRARTVRLVPPLDRLAREGFNPGVLSFMHHQVLARAADSCDAIEALQAEDLRVLASHFLPTDGAIYAQYAVTARSLNDAQVEVLVNAMKDWAIEADLIRAEALTLEGRSLNAWRRKVEGLGMRWAMVQRAADMFESAGAMGHSLVRTMRWRQEDAFHGSGMEHVAIKAGAVLGDAPESALRQAGAEKHDPARPRPMRLVA